MYINIGNAFCIIAEEIVGVFDFESTTISKRTRDFLSVAQKKDKIINISPDIPKSFIVVKKDNKNYVYLSPLATTTVLKRINNINEIFV